MRLYHFLNAEHALDDIRKKRIKISLIPDLNDPFELWTIPLPASQHRKVWQATVQDIGKKFGVICLSRKWSNPLLWSHYAHKHFGICLGFDVDDELIKDVIYRKSKLTWPLDVKKPNGGLNQVQMQKILYTKFSDWRYEDEVRVMANLNDPEPCACPDNPNRLCYFSDFNSKFQLKEVIVGIRSKVTKVEIQKSLKDYQHHVKIVKARLAFNTFSVVPNKKGFLIYCMPNERQLFRL